MQEDLLFVLIRKLNSLTGLYFPRWLRKLVSNQCIYWDSTISPFDFIARNTWLLQSHGIFLLYSIISSHVIPVILPFATASSKHFFVLSVFYNLYKFIQMTILLNICITCFGWKKYGKSYNFMGFENNSKNAVYKNRDYPKKKKSHYYAGTR